MLVDRETLDVVRLEVEEFVRGSFLDPAQSPMVAVSSLTGAGLDELKQALAESPPKFPRKILPRWPACPSTASSP